MGKGMGRVNRLGMGVRGLPAVVHSGNRIVEVEIAVADDVKVPGVPTLRVAELMGRRAVSFDAAPAALLNEWWVA